jgi:hypothetical protein
LPPLDRAGPARGSAVHTVKAAFHCIIEDAAQVIIVDLLHNRSDLPGKLAALTDPKPSLGN